MAEKICKLPPEDKRSDPQAWKAVSWGLLEKATTGEISAQSAKQVGELLDEACQMWTGQTMEEIARMDHDVVSKVRHLMQTSTPDLEKMIGIVKDAERLRAPEAEKKKWIGLIEATIELQKKCRKDPFLAMMYYGRDQESRTEPEMFTPAKVHRRFFDIWRDEKRQHSLIMAPPGHSKSTCLIYLIAFEIAEQPSLRWLYLALNKNEAKKRIMALRRIITSPEYQALFPHVQILTRKDKTTETGLSFTVRRVNDFSFEPTVEGASIDSGVNGAGYDHIAADDFDPPEVRYHEHTRQKNRNTWFAVTQARLRNPQRAKIRMICTPWHTDATACYIQREHSRGKFQDWSVNVDEFKIRDDPKTGVAIPIWDKFSPEFFEEKKLETDYDLNYRLTPLKQGERVVSRVAYYDKDRKDLAQKYAECERWLSIDPAGTARQSSSAQGVTDWYLHSSGYALCDEAHEIFLGAAEMQQWILDKIVSSYNSDEVPISTVLIEAESALKGQVSGWCLFLDGGLRDHRIMDVSIIDTSTRLKGRGQCQGKVARLHSVASAIERGRALFRGHVTHVAKDGRRVIEPEYGTKMYDLVEAIKTFDGTKHPDIVDTVSQFLIYNFDRLKTEAPDLSPQRQPEPPKKVDAMTRLFFGSLQEENKTEESKEESLVFIGEKACWN